MDYYREEMRALDFAFRAHTGQKRKYTNEPYICHCIAVADIVKTVSQNINLIQAAYLHDTIEDTLIDETTLRTHFNDRVVNLVLMVTDISTIWDGNRAVRKAKDCQHLAKADAEGQTLKLADIIHNTQSILTYDPKFAKTYLQEKRELMNVLTKGNQELRQRAYEGLR